MVFDIFLGGSCNQLNWRKKIAIPLLSKYGVTFYNPEVEEWTPSHMELEKNAIAESKVLLFFVSEESFSVASMVEIGYYIGQKRNVVLCLSLLSENCKCKYNCSNCSQAFSGNNRARRYLKAMAEESNVPVFHDLTTAVKCAISRTSVKVHK